MSKKMYLVMRNCAIDGRGPFTPCALYENKSDAEKFVNEDNKDNIYDVFSIKPMEVTKPKVLSQMIYKNNWMSHSYIVEGNIFNDKEKTFKVVNQHGKEYKVFTREVVEHYSDHGHSNSVTSLQFYIDFSSNSGLPEGTLVSTLCDLMKNGMKFYVEQ